MNDLLPRTLIHRALVPMSPFDAAAALLGWRHIRGLHIADESNATTAGLALLEEIDRQCEYWATVTDQLRAMHLDAEGLLSDT